MNRFDLVDTIAFKLSHSFSSYNFPRVGKTSSITFDDFVGWAGQQTVFSVACNSYSEVLVVLQTL